MICPSCKAENPEGFRLCGYCGATLAVTGTPETRKVVTLVFADVTGSTPLGERLDAESARWVMSSFFKLARTTLERHGGLVEKFIGDAVMAAFGIPLVREDDALRAVRAAGELRDQLSAFSREVEALRNGRRRSHRRHYGRGRRWRPKRRRGVREWRRGQSRRATGAGSRAGRCPPR
jgi:class 3 adenylate cyclase